MISRIRPIVLNLCLLFSVTSCVLASPPARRPYLALGDRLVFGFIAQAGNAYGNPENFIGYPDYVGQIIGMREFDAGLSRRDHRQLSFRRRTGRWVSSF